MKKIILIPSLIVLFLYACTSTEQPTQINSSPSLEPTLTKVIPSEIPATSTPDPMANAPLGATGVDGQGIYYMDADDGYRYFYFGETLVREAYWARPWIENYSAFDDWEVDAIPIDVWVKLSTSGSESIVGMAHRDVTTSEDRSTMTDELYRPLTLRFEYQDLFDMRDGLESGIAFDFVFNGTTMSSTFGKNGGFQITFVSEDELKSLHEQGKAVRANGNLGFIYIMYDGVENGQVLVRLASSQPLDKLLGNSPVGDPQYELRKMIFLPLMNILVTDEDYDLINMAAMRDAGIVASRSAFPRTEDGMPDLQIIIRP